MNEQQQNTPNVGADTNLNISSDNVQFEESTLDMKERKVISKTNSKMAEMLMKLGIIESERAANFILAGVAVFFFLMSFLIFILGAAQTPSDAYLKAVDHLQKSKIETE